VNLAAWLRRANLRFAPGRLLLGPEWLVLGVNNACNLSCRMCDVGLGRDDTNFGRNLTGSRPLDMPWDLYERIVSEAAASRPRPGIGFAFTEPLLWRPLVDAVALARSRGVATAVTTNGWRLPELAAPLAAAGLDDLFLSLDGPPDAHDAIRGREGSFERAVRGLDALLSRSPRPAVSVFCVVTPWNTSRLAEFVGLFSELPLAGIGFLHANFTTAAMAAAHNAVHGGTYPATESNLGPLDPAAYDLPALAAAVVRVRALRPPFRVTFSPEIDGLDALRRFYLEPGTFWGRLCNDAARALMVKSDGRVIPAHGRCYDVTVGNLREDSLADVWNSPGIADFRRTLVREGGLLPACARCCSAF
jgi:MoaA/NifB/PqqE/SkfB family radical SAM enzyme